MLVFTSHETSLMTLLSIRLHEKVHIPSDQLHKCEGNDMRKLQALPVEHNSFEDVQEHYKPAIYLYTFSINPM